LGVVWGRVGRGTLGIWRGSIGGAVYATPGRRGCDGDGAIGGYDDAGVELVLVLVVFGVVGGYGA
jgi:hypothetical protein